jgi:hypothetical protein
MIPQDDFPFEFDRRSLTLATDTEEESKTIWNF